MIHYGYSVSISGLTAVVGAYQNDDSVGDGGTAYVYSLDPSTDTWNEIKLNASDASAADYFGAGVSISGRTIAVSALGDDDTHTYLYFYKADTGTWEEKKIQASDASSTDAYGTSISVDGFSVITGSKLDDDNGSNSGSAYIFDLQF